MGRHCRGGLAFLDVLLLDRNLMGSASVLRPTRGVMRKAPRRRQVGKWHEVKRRAIRSCQNPAAFRSIMTAFVALRHDAKVNGIGHRSRFVGLGEVHRTCVDP